MLKRKLFLFVFSNSIRLLRFTSAQLRKLSVNLEKQSHTNIERISELQLESIGLERDAAVAQRFSDSIERILANSL